MGLGLWVRVGVGVIARVQFLIKAPLSSVWIWFCAKARPLPVRRIGLVLGWCARVQREDACPYLAEAGGCRELELALAERIKAGGSMGQ